jgi:hypothetical protein
MWGMLFRGPKTSRRTLVALLMVAWCLGCLGQGQPATTSGGLTASHSTGPPMPRKLLQLEGAAGGATTMISNAGGDHLRSTGNAASPPNRPPPPALVASEEPELSMPAAPSSSDSSGERDHALQLYGPSLEHKHALSHPTARSKALSLLVPTCDTGCRHMNCVYWTLLGTAMTFFG